MAENVFLFVPNLIGYVRIILAFISFYYMPTHPIIAASTYILSGFLDNFDGHAARCLNQGTKFGAMLDMLTDRCVTACLMMMLCVFYPKYLFLFQFLLSLDISSHWIHVQSSMMKGDASHKKIDLSGNPILRVYYTSKPVLFLMCTGNELFFSMLYLIHFTPGPMVTIAGRSVGMWVALAWLTFPICAIKQFINLVHLVTACINTARLDLADRAKAVN